MKSEIADPPRTYKQALVTLIDILGFKNLVASSTSDKVYDILRRKDRLPGPLSLWRSFAKQYNYVFSDLIVSAQFFGRSRVREDERELAFFAPIALHLRLVGNQQFSLACDRTFVRGGIVLGDIYADRTTIFGPALIRAYELESQIARWPIIIFDRYLVAEFNERWKQHDDPLVKSFITRTENGIYFLDYIGVMQYEDVTTGDLDYKLDDHRKAIISAFEETTNETYREKYHFLAAYHDRKCDQYNYPGLKIGTLA